MTAADRATRQVSYANQPMIARNDGSRAGLISAAMPQPTPNRIHAALVGSRWQRIASAMIPTNEHAEMLVSQKIVGIQASGSETAQNRSEEHTSELQSLRHL